MDKGFTRSRKTIAAFVPNILNVSPGQRVRIEFWEEFLKNAGWEIEYFQFENESLHEILYKEGNSAAKLRRLFECYLRQFNRVISKTNADLIFIYREVSLIGPALLERIIARKKIPIIYDIDDPVFLPYRSPVNGWASLLKFPQKTHKLFELSTHIIAINDLIGNYAARFNKNVSIIPNCVDTNIYIPPADNVNTDKDVKMIWIGSHSTMQNLIEIAEPIKVVQTKCNSPLLVIGAGSSGLDGINLEVRQWTAKTEVQDLQEGKIGLLPVNDLEWNHWKFFYKTIQYMAIGIPVIARDIGSNTKIIENGINGFVVKSNQEWVEKIMLLINNENLRKKMGEAARQTVLNNYSVMSQMPKMVDIFERVLEESKRYNVN